jgi:hypothetical protein
VSGEFVVSGTHSFAPSSIAYPVTVTIKDMGGSTATAASTVNAYVALGVTGGLNPASDSGVSNSDGITNVVQPAFFGTTSQPDVGVTLYAQPLDGGSAFVIGQGASAVDGTWNITATRALTDGRYAISAVAFNQAGQIASSTTTIVPDLVIDTVGPAVTGVALRRLDGQIRVEFQDFGGPGNAGVGLSLKSIVDANNYSLSRALHARAGAFPVTGAAITPGTAVGTQFVTLTVNEGRHFRGGRFLFTIRSVSPGDLSGVQDIAGNALDGEFYGRFPSGNGRPGGNLVAGLDAIHNTVFTPKSVVGTAAASPGREMTAPRTEVRSRATSGRPLKVVRTTGPVESGHRPVIRVAKHGRSAPGEVGPGYAPSLRSPSSHHDSRRG